MNKDYDLILTILGLFIMVTIAIMAIVDSEATDLISVIPSSIVGGSLFIAGYISYRNKCDK
ncbi:MAG: hypothetical protein KQ78_02079 [Candidatus Izimaplasma bacterium HR2]|nr:MAG: hypothetical protein KQ78_02079 [Candidatus Izimaplasma bacterium HR2]